MAIITHMRTAYRYHRDRQPPIPQWRGRRRQLDQTAPRTCVRWFATSRNGMTIRPRCKHSATNSLRAYKIAMTPPMGPWLSFVMPFAGRAKQAQEPAYSKLAMSDRQAATSAPSGKRPKCWLPQTSSHSIAERCADSKWYEPGHGTGRRPESAVNNGGERMHIPIDIRSQVMAPVSRT